MYERQRRADEITDDILSKLTHMPRRLTTFRQRISARAAATWAASVAYRPASGAKALSASNRVIATDRLNRGSQR
jgi:hypothetical protein